MKPPPPTSQLRPTNQRNRCRIAAFIAPGFAALLLLNGCQDDVTKEFRDAAGESLQTGVSAILDGFVDGFFAVLEPNEETAADGG